MENIEVKIAEVSESTKQAHKRIDELQTVIKAFYELASDVKVMANELKNIKNDVIEIKDNISNNVTSAQLRRLEEKVNQLNDEVAEKNNEPNKLFFSVKSAIINGIAMIIVSSVMALIISNL